MITLGHEHMVDYFYGPFHNAFYPEATKIGFNLEGGNPFTKWALMKICGKNMPSPTWEVASNHMPSPALAISAIPQPPRHSNDE
jgi:hypothetical protein